MTWLSGWNYRKSKIINGSTAGQQTDYQLFLTVYKSPGTDTSTSIYCNNHIKDDFSDLRFTLADGSTLINYWIESYISGISANVWIKIPFIPISPSSESIYIYYGNPYASSLSNGANTFILFDNFEGTGLLTWTNNAGTWSTTGGFKKQTSTSTNAYKFSYISGTVLPDSYIVHAKIYVPTAFSTSGREGLLIETTSTPSSEQYAIVCGPTTSVTTNLEMLDNNYADYGSTVTGVTRILGTWYHIEALRQANIQKGRLWSIDSSIPSWTTSTTRTSLAVKQAGLFGGYDNEIWFDDFYVRNYVSPEPSFSTSGIEELSCLTPCWLTGWSKRKLKTIIGSTSSQTDYQIQLTVYKSLGTDTPSSIYCNNYVKDDFSDLRFTAEDGSTILNHWIESYISSISAIVWIKIPYIPQSPDSASIYLYYNNSSATNISNGSTTFNFFDDFDNLNLWTQQSNTWTTSNSLLHVPSGDGWLRNNSQLSIMTNYEVVYRNNPYTSNYGLMHIVKSNSPLNYNPGIYVEDVAYLQGSNKSPRLYIDGISYYGNGNSLTSTWLQTKLRIQSNNTSASLYQESTGTLLANVNQSSTTTSTNNYFGFRAYGPIDVDWMYVRKYASPEPYWDITGIEQTSCTPSCWLNGWTRRKSKAISSATSPQFDYQIKFIIKKGTGADAGDTVYLGNMVNDDFSDIRFTLSNDTNPLSYWIESYTSATQATVWVKIPYIPQSPDSTTIYLYYGNACATNASNGTYTFLFYATGSDAPNWTNIVTNVGGELHFAWSGASGSNRAINITGTYAIESRFRNESTTNQNLYFMTGANPGGTNFISGQRNVMSYQDAGTTVWKAYNNNTPVSTIYSSLALSTYYILREIRKGASLYDHYLFDSNRNILGSSLNTTFGYGGEIDPITAIQFASGSSGWSINTYVTWIFVRKYTSPEPTLGSWGLEELAPSISWLTGWTRRKLKTINGTSSYQQNYQMKFKIYKSSGSDAVDTVYCGGNVKDDFSDIRFTSKDGLTLLDYWIESYISAVSAIVWVKIPYILQSPDTSTIYFYYNNPSALSISNGFNTFIFFDDFNDGIYTDKWVSQGAWTESGGTIKNTVRTDVAPFPYLRTINPVLTGLIDFAVEGRTRALHQYGYGMLLAIKSGTDPYTGNYYQPRCVYTYSASSPIFEIDGVNRGSGSVQSVVNTWYRPKVIINPAGTHAIYQYNDDGTLFSSVTGITVDSASTSNYFALKPADGLTEQDWIFIRNYSNPEPGYGAWCIEETFVCPTCSVNMIILDLLDLCRYKINTVDPKIEINERI